MKRKPTQKKKERPTTTLTIRLRVSERLKLERLAEAERRSVTSLVRYWIASTDEAGGKS